MNTTIVYSDSKWKEEIVHAVSNRIHANISRISSVT